jgi:hypothetical protein
MSRWPDVLEDFMLDVDLALLDPLSADGRRRVFGNRRTMAEEIKAVVAVGDFEKPLALAGRKWGPDFLIGWERAGFLDDKQLRVLLPYVWSLAEYPERTLGRATRLRLFARTGFISETGRLAPTEPLVIWRGQRDGRPPRMAWTTTATGPCGTPRRDGAVNRPAAPYRAVAPPEAVLAFVDAKDGRGEDEVIVNPHLLQDVEMVTIAP